MITWTITEQELTITFAPSVGKPIVAVKGAITLRVSGITVIVKYETANKDFYSGLRLNYTDVTSPTVTGVSDLHDQLLTMIRGAASGSLTLAQLTSLLKTFDGYVDDPQYTLAPDGNGGFKWIQS